MRFKLSDLALARIRGKSTHEHRTSHFFAPVKNNLYIVCNTRNDFEQKEIVPYWNNDKICQRCMKVLFGSGCEIAQ